MAAGRRRRRRPKRSRRSSHFSRAIARPTSPGRSCTFAATRCRSGRTRHRCARSRAARGGRRKPSLMSTTTRSVRIACDASTRSGARGRLVAPSRHFFGLQAQFAARPKHRRTLHLRARLGFSAWASACAGLCRAAAVYIACAKRKPRSPNRRAADAHRREKKRYTPSRLAFCLHSRGGAWKERIARSPGDSIHGGSAQLTTHWRIEMTYQHLPKVLTFWVALARLMPAPRAFSQERIEQPERAERQERAEGVERRDRSEGVERAERSGRIDRPERAERVDRIERVEKLERMERPERIERVEKLERVERPERVERVERVEKLERVERPQRVERVERPQRVERPERVERRGR